MTVIKMERKSLMLQQKQAYFMILYLNSISSMLLFISSCCCWCSYFSCQGCGVLFFFRCFCCFLFSFHKINIIYSAHWWTIVCIIFIYHHFTGTQIAIICFCCSVVYLNSVSRLCQQLILLHCIGDDDVFGRHVMSLFDSNSL